MPSICTSPYHLGGTNGITVPARADSAVILKDMSVTPAGPRRRSRPGRPVIGYLLNRALHALLVLFVVSMLAFVLGDAIGDPVASILGMEARPRIG